MATFQSDGNFVFYEIGRRALWASGTNGRNATRLALQDDGNMVIYSSSGSALWSTGTVGR